jgi:hypothetical protein
MDREKSSANLRSVFFAREQSEITNETIVLCPLLKLAVRRGEEAIVREIPKYLLKARSSEGWGALHYARHGAIIRSVPSY